MSEAGDSAFPLILPADDASVSIARHCVGQRLTQLGCATQRVTDAVIAVSEAVTNAVLHAYTERATGTVRVNLTTDASSFSITVDDDGRGPGPNLSRRGGCFGLPMMAALADRLTIEGNEKAGTRITMSFPAPQEQRTGQIPRRAV